MNVSTIILLVVLLLFAAVGVIFICRAGWSLVREWIAQPLLCEERKRQRLSKRRLQRSAEQREAALLRGATEVARTMVRSVLKVQLQFLAVREDEHQRRALALMARASKPSASRAANDYLDSPVQPAITEPALVSSGFSINRHLLRSNAANGHRNSL
jgi:hypothetical protein